MKRSTAVEEWDVPREKAIPRLLELHGSGLYALAIRLCKNRQDAEDLVQETFLQAFRKWDQFAGRSNPVNRRPDIGRQKSEGRRPNYSL